MPEPRGRIEFTETGLGGILRQYRLRVPANQREYAWTEKEVTTLFTDLAKAIANERNEDYFLGTIVTIPRSPDLLEVADGQQRLATTAILLAEIRNYLRPTEQLISESIDTDFLTDIDREKRQRVAKLTLNLDDNEFFGAMLRSAKDSERPQPTNHSSHKLIKESFSLARKQVGKIVAGFDKKDHGDILNRWIRFLEHGAQVILLKVPTVANAYKMFETLNDRGLKTSQADLVKNYLFGQAEERLPEAQQKWARMRSTLETLEEEDITVTFLRQAMIAIQGHLRESEVYDKVQERVKGPHSSVQFLSQLETMAATYVAIFNPEHEKWNSYPDAMRRAIQTLNLVNIRSMRPLMLAIASAFSEKEASEAFRMLITWGVRLVVASSTSRGAVEEPLANTGNKVFLGEITTAAQMRKALSAIIPGDDDFRKAFEIASVSKAAFARYYLRSLEMAAKNEAAPWFIPNDDKQVINLEHILPEVPGGNWPQFTEEEARVCSKRIGNLALLQAKANSDLRSDEFASKKAMYKNSPYELTRQIAKVKDWTPASIALRQKGLAELALKAWPL
jgi:Protein of unknown function DUF262/Protein of unknown function (DUF1524)